VARATIYRQRRPQTLDKPPRRRPVSHRALSGEECQQVLELLHSPRFVDASPSEVYATLLDEGLYLCSQRTMYRLLHSHDEVRERRRLRRHPQYSKPELLATGPNQVWSWDITKLRGPGRGEHYSLYVILDIFSRYVVGWLLADRESKTLAQRLIEETVAKQEIPAGQLILHADRGSAMTSNAVAQLLADLGVLKSHSRPHTSDDNPFSEAQFKTLKYHPLFPDHFAGKDDARQFCRTFFDWYNRQHRHSGLALLTPEQVHTGQSEIIVQQRAQTLNAAYRSHPHRFGRPPQPQLPPTAAWINPPDPSQQQSPLIAEDFVSQMG
jgi:putative transposase